MKKFLSLFLAIFVILLSACSNSSSDGGSTDSGSNDSADSSKPAETSSDNGSSSDKNVTLRYAIWDKNQEPGMQKIVEKFKENHPNIDVNVEVTPWDQYWQKLETAASANTLPDLFWLNAANFDLYASNDMLMQIGDKIKAESMDMTVYPSSLVDLYSYKGSPYAIPKDFDTIGLWYNKTLFDAANIPYPDDTWDWEKLHTAAKKLTDPSKGIYGIAAQMANQEGFYNTIFQNGGFVISDDKKKLGYDQPEAIEGLKFWVDLIKDGASPTQAQMTDTEPTALFESGKVAMIYAGSWMQVEFAANEYTKDKVDVAAMPMSQGKQRATVIHGLGNVVANNTKYQNEAWEFLKFLGSKEAADIQANSGVVIPAYNGTQDPWVKSNPNFHLQVFIDELKYSKPYPVSLYTRKWQQLETDYFTKVWAGQMSVEDAVKAVVEQGNQILASETNDN